MDSDDDAQEMNLLQDQSANEYAPLLHLLQSRHLAAFKSLIRRALNKEPPAIDINHLIGHPTNQTFLDKAASENLPDFVEFLLEVGANPNLLNEEFKRAPIHFAAEEGNSDALRILLQARNIQPNLIAAGQTALHFAVKANCEECVRLLLLAEANPNIPNSQGKTALHFAAEKNDRNMVQLIIDNSTILDLDTYRDRRKETARMIIVRKFPDIILPKETDKPDYSVLLRYHLTANDESNFLANLKKVNDLDELSNKTELLKLAVEHNLRDATSELISRGALIHDELFDLGKICLERAHPEILKKLISGKSNLADRLLMIASQELGVPVSPGPGNRNNRLECLKIILGHSDVDVRQEDDKGNSPLHYAARAECREAVELLLRKGSYIGHRNSFGTPPLANIAPGVLESHLDECLTSTNERTEEYEIIFDYMNLVPHNTECGATDDYLEKARKRSSLRRKNPCSETEALLYIAEDKNLRHLLKHPLLSSFLYLKYLRIRHVLYVNFLLYFVFFIILNLYIWVITSEAADVEKLARNLTMREENGNSGEEIIENGIMENWENHPILSILVLISMSYLVIRESLQLISSPIQYAMSPENWLEITLIGLTFALLLGADREVGACAILLSTWELVILIAQHPRMSTDIEMFKTVTINFTKFLFLYIFLILAFALSFFVLFKGDDNFPNPFGSLFKTIIMLTGEFDSSDLPFVTYPILSRLIFIGFIFLIVIILLNLLNGLAVNDTGEILAEAELVCLISRAKLVAYAERMVVGTPMVPSTRLLCCCPPILQQPFQNLTKSPMRFISRRILLFPRYLPHARLSVKPLKSHEITIHGRTRQTRSASACNALTMDSLIVQRAKEILIERDRESNDEKIMALLQKLSLKVDEKFETVLMEIRNGLRNNNDDNIRTDSPIG